MFIQLGSSYVNSDEISEFELVSVSASGPNVKIQMKNGNQRAEYLSEEMLNNLCATVIPAQVGYYAYGINDVWFDEGPEPFIWTPVVAFSVQQNAQQLVPITAEDGYLNSYAVHCPNGRVYTSSEMYFESVKDFEEFEIKRHKKEKRAS